MALVSLAIVLGGGGTVNPRNEMILQGLTALIMLFFVLSTEYQRDMGPVPRSAWLVAGLVLIVPTLQLVPLPPSVWHNLPGRALEIQSLQLVQADKSWMPLTMSPTRTFASLLATIFPLLLLLQIARLPVSGRGWIGTAIVACGVFSLLLGVLQLSQTGGRDWSLYAEYSEGYLVGFQANRNAEADILLIVALAVGMRVAQHGGHGRRKTTTAIALAIGVLPMFIGVFLTGSRTGVILTGLVALILSVMFWPILKPDRKALLPLGIGLGCAAAIAALLAQLPAVHKTIIRFTIAHEARWDLWADTLYAARQVWPFGSGIGTIVPMLEAAERLDEVDPTSPVRAHNDWLEYVLESGAPGLIALAVVLLVVGILAYRALRQSMNPSTDSAYRAQTLFSLGTLLVIGLHSIVDYPLRSMALASLAAVAVAFLCAPAALQRNQQ